MEHQPAKHHADEKPTARVLLIATSRHHLFC